MITLQLGLHVFGMDFMLKEYGNFWAFYEMPRKIKYSTMALGIIGLSKTK